MEKGVEIIWHDIEPARHVEERIRQRVERLDKMFDRIVGVHVTIEAPHRRHRKGNEFEVRVVVTMPGEDIVVNRRPGDDHAHFDPLVAVRDAFDAVERKLKEWKERHRGRPPRVEEGPPRGHILEIDQERGIGVISGANGQRIRFDRAALMGEDPAALAPGQPVHFTLDPTYPPENPHAASVWRAGA